MINFDDLMAQAQKKQGTIDFNSLAAQAKQKTYAKPQTTVKPIPRAIPRISKSGEETVLTYKPTAEDKTLHKVYPPAIASGVASGALNVARTVPFMAAGALADGGASKRFEESNNYAQKPVAEKQMELANKIANIAQNLSYPGQKLDTFISESEKGVAQLQNPGNRLFGETLIAAGQMAPAIGVGMAGGAVKGMSAFAAQVYGGSFKDALDRGADVKNASDYALGQTLIETGSEMAFGGIAGLGKGIIPTLIVKSGAKKLAAKVGVDMAAKTIGSAVKTAVTSKTGMYLLNLLGEAAEEVIAEVLSPYVERATIDPNAPNATMGEIKKSAIMGGLMSAFLGVGGMMHGVTLDNGKTITTPQEVETLTEPELNEFDEKLYELARQSNLRKGKITEDKAPIEGWSAEAMANERGLPSPVPRVGETEEYRIAREANERRGKLPIQNDTVNATQQYGLPSPAEIQIEPEAYRLAREANERRGKTSIENDVINATSNAWVAEHYGLPAPHKSRYSPKTHKLNTGKGLVGNEAYKAAKTIYAAKLDEITEYIKNYKGKGTNTFYTDENGYGVNPTVEVVNGGARRTSVSNNDQWYQDFWKEHNRKPNKGEARELAKKILDDSLKYDYDDGFAYDGNFNELIRGIYQNTDLSPFEILDRADSDSRKYERRDTTWDSMFPDQVETVPPIPKLTTSKTDTPPVREIPGRVMPGEIGASNRGNTTNIRRLSDSLPKVEPKVEPKPIPLNNVGVARTISTTNIPQQTTPKPLPFVGVARTIPTTNIPAQVKAPKQETKGETNERNNNVPQARKQPGTRESAVQKLNDEINRKTNQPLETVHFENSTHSQKGAVEKIAKVFGVDVVFVKQLTPESRIWNGSFVDGIIAISDSAETPVNVVYGHELLHQIKQTDTKTYENFKKVFLGEMSAEKRSKYQEMLRSVADKSGISLTDEQIVEEMIADFSGEMFNDPKIMKRIFEKDKPLARKMYEIINKMIQQLRSYLDKDYIVSDGIKNLEAVKDAYVDAMQSYVGTDSIKDSEVNEKKSSDVKFSMKRDSEGRNLTAEQQEFFKNVSSDLRDENGNIKPYYHGTRRADRVGNYFNPKRSTSGPMAFFTDDNEIAKNYSISKGDTSLAYEDANDYYKQFKVNFNGKEMNVYEIWGKLTLSEAGKISSRAKQIRFDDEGDQIILDPENKIGSGGYDLHYIENKRNAIKALYAEWLDSGNLFNQEERFLDVLKLAGIEGVKYNDPDYAEPKVYDVYLNITKPLNTALIPKSLISKLKKASETAVIGESYSADPWDKNDITPEEWIERLEGDIEKNTTHAWTSIPDWVTNVLRENGYDGIVDSGGKYTGYSHQVVIPFDSNQIKSVNNLKPTSDPDIRYSLMRDSEGKHLTKEQAEFFKDSKAVDKEGNLLKVYHGSPRYDAITRFKRGTKGWLGGGIYLTSDKNNAENYADKNGPGYGKIYELYANIKNPLYVRSGNPVPEILLAIYKQSSIYENRSAQQTNDPSILTKADINKLQKKGYDAIIWEFGGSTEISVFNPNQVKSATNIHPTTDPDIRYSLMRNSITNQALEIAQEDEIRAAVKEFYPQTKDISTRKGGRNDIWEVFRMAFGKAEPVMKKLILDPFAESKGEAARYRMQKAAGLKQEMTRLGIKKGSRESVAIREYGEGMRISKKTVTDYQTGKQHKEYVEETYTLNDLKREFPQKWQDIVEADKWFRREYDDFIDRINAMKTLVYPNAEKRYNEYEDKIMRVKAGTGRYKNYSEQEKTDAVNRLRSEQDRYITGKRIAKRKDYYRHYREMNTGFAALYNIFDSPAQIGGHLAGKSSNTKPLSMWESFAQHRKGNFTEADAIGGYLDYLPGAAYAIYIDQHISKFRTLADALENASDKENDLTGLITTLRNYANHLAGKSSDGDRSFAEKAIGGRKTIRALNWMNNRVKANVILFNMGATLSQLANIPGGIAYIKDPRSLARGLYHTLNKNPVINQSNFMPERTEHTHTDNFDEKLLGKPKEFAVWMISGGDAIGTTFIWYSAYENALAKGSENPVLEADDVTRMLVAGRGIGEVPLNQTESLTKLILPFTLEVQNMWRIQKRFVNEKDFGGLLLFWILSFLFNEGTEEVRGTRILFDPVHTILEVLSGEELSALEIGGRLAGEVLSNTPAGQYAAALYPEYGWQGMEGVKLPTRKQLFGDTDPTRFGSGLLVQQAITDPIFKLIPPMGGAQIKKTYDFLKSAQAIPVLNPTSKDFGHKQGIKALQKGGKIKFGLGDSAETMIKGTLFGAYATDEGKKYIEDDSKPIGEKHSAIAEKLARAGMDGVEAVDLARTLPGKKAESARRLIMNSDLTTKQKNIAGGLVNSTIKVDYSSKVSYEFSLLPKETRQKYLIVKQYGVSQKDFLKIMNTRDADGNGSTKKQEAINALEATNLSRGQKAAMWPLISTANNPYN